jgi:hypothetical protein
MTDLPPPRFNPSLRWLVAYLVAGIAGTLVASVGTAVVVADPGQAGLVSLWATRVLPFVLAMLFVPVALLTFLLHKAGLWSMSAFAIAGAAIPAVFFALLFAVTPGGSAGENFVSLLVIWAVAGAVGGVAFHSVFARLG